MVVQIQHAGIRRPAERRIGTSEFQPEGAVAPSRALLHGQLHVAVIRKELVQAKLWVARVLEFKIRFVYFLARILVVSTRGANDVRNLTRRTSRPNRTR